VANSALIAFHPVLLGQAVSLMCPDLPQAAHRFVKIAARLDPSSRRKLVGIAQQLILQERLRRSISSLQLLSRVQAAVSSAVQGGGYLFPLNAGGDIAAMAFLVLMMATNDADKDLEAIMDQVKAETAAKEALRTLLAELAKLEAAMAGRSSFQSCAAILRIQSKYTPYH
jgi:hypothetical protein